MFITTWRRSEPVNPSSLAVFYWDVRRSEVLTGWQRRPCSGCAALAQGRGAGTYRRATRSPMQRWSHRWNSWGWCCPGAGKTPGNPKDIGGISVNPYLCILMNCINDAINAWFSQLLYLLDAHRLSDVELPLALERVQVPELGRVTWRGDGVAAGTVDRNRRDRSLMAAHPTDQLLGVWG